MPLTQSQHIVLKNNMSVNKLILKQLEKVKDAKVSPYDEIRHSYYIKKFKEINFEVHHCYLVRINDALLNSTNIIASNYNNGSYPEYNYMKIDVSKRVGNMIYVDGIYYDNESKQDINTMWSGWLPITEIELIEEL